MSDEPKHADAKSAADHESKAKSAAAWLEQNQEALESSNAYVENYGLPLAGYRMF